MMKQVFMLDLNINSLNSALQPYGLIIDESTINGVNEYVPLFNIQFCIDINGNLQSDLLVKPTNAWPYFNFNSAHKIMRF